MDRALFKSPFLKKKPLLMSWNVPRMKMMMVMKMMPLLVMKIPLLVMVMGSRMNSSPRRVTVL